MRWKNGKPGEQVVVTYNGRPGACAAAAVLLKHPDAGIYISSTYHLARCLSSISKHESIREIHICGMGYKGPVLDLLEALKRLHERAIKVNWYCGNYWNMDQVGPGLAKLCTLHHSPDSDSDTNVIVDALGLAGNEHTGMLLELSDMNAQPTGLAKDLSDLVEAGKFRYFQFGDLASYPGAIRKLAAQYPLSPEERKAVRLFKAAGQSEGLDGCSPAIRKIKGNLSRYGRLDRVNVLILGETGVGKERVARLLHFASPRAEEPFFCENCATLSGEGLINSRLFGHVKGAFTGAVQDTEGILDAADGGVLFLDEIGEMPLDTQAKLLRVIDNGAYTPVGSVQEKRTDVRIIAATNCDLGAMVNERAFRIDLFYRLNQLVIVVPPLRERLEDIPHLAGSIRRELERKHDMELLQLTEEQTAALSSYSWPGNVRQLYNVLQKAWILEMMDDIDNIITEQAALVTVASPTEMKSEVNAAPLSISSGGPLMLPSMPSDVVPADEVMSKYASEALTAFGGNKTKTAEALGISVNTLNKKLRSQDQR